MTRAEIEEKLMTQGFVIIENAISNKELTVLQEQLKTSIATGRADHENSFMGDKIIRFGALLRKIPAVRTLVLNSHVIEACEDVLLPYAPKFQLHYTGVMHVQEGAEAQILHRDTSPFPNPSPTVVLATMWAINDFKRENGATVYVPNSHLWHDMQIPKPEDLRVAEMPAGSVLIYMGNLIHGSGECSVGFRTGLSLQYSVSWLKQEENQFLACPMNLARDFPEELQKLMGYDLAGSHWNYVDQQHPLDFLNGKNSYGKLDAAEYEFKDRVKALYPAENGFHLGHRYDMKK